MRIVLLALLLPSCVFIDDDAAYWRTRDLDTNPDGCQPLDWYADKDGDGYGDPDDVSQACEQPTATVDNGEDCDDTDAALNPETEWFADNDADGYGGSEMVTGCEQPSGSSLEGGDCDDSDAGVNPGAEEDCTTAEDDDCSGETNQQDATGCINFLADSDGDGFGAGDPACWCAPSGDYTSQEAGDCDDGEASVYPGAEEICDDGLDNDCNGSAGECAPSGLVDATSADAVLLGEANKDNTAYSVSGADLNGDGIMDAVISAHANDRSGNAAGAVFVVAGPVSGVVDLGTEATLAIEGQAAGDRIGWSLAGAGDLNGDGFDEIIVGSPYDSTVATEAGAAWLIYGPASGTLGMADVGIQLTGLTASQQVGFAVGAGGDLTDDGTPDVLVGAYKDARGGSAAGAVYIVDGMAGGGSLGDAVAEVVGTESGARLGFATTVAGDLDGDGIDDLLVAADRAVIGGNDDAGATYIFLGPLGGSLTKADADGTRFGGEDSAYAGFSLSRGGDVDGDGLDDFYIGAPGAGSDTGSVFLISGPGEGSEGMGGALARIDGSATGDEAGSSVAGDFDFDGDGSQDVVVGAWKADQPATDSGGAWLVYGPLSGTRTLGEAGLRVSMGDAGGRSGYSVAVPGDLTGNGLPDLLVGAPFGDGGATDSGAALLVEGGGL